MPNLLESEASGNCRDQAWKDVIHENADEAISFFMPTLAAERDYSRKPESANQIHSPIGGDTNKGERTSDLCLSVPLSTGGESRAMFLIEQQHEDYQDLPLRIFQSFYRASDKFQVPVTALAIFTGNEHPVDTYDRAYHGTEVHFKYNAYNVMDTSTEALKRDERFFALPSGRAA